MTNPSTSKEVLDFVQKIRHEYLRRVGEGTAAQKDYSKIIDFFRSSRPINPYQRQYETQSHSLENFSTLPSSELQKSVILILYSYFESKPEEFRNIGPDAQYIIWSLVFPCVESLIKIRNDVQNIRIYQKNNNYPDSCEFTRLYLNKLAQSYSLLVKLENQLGVERYLASSGLEHDILFIHLIVQEIRKTVNNRLKNTKLEFQTQWNLTSISTVIKKLLGETVQENSVTCNFSSDQNRVIFILLDGVGYAQYLWYQEGVKNQRNAIFGINIFDWLANFDEYHDKFILGSTLIPDTGCAIATIYSGKLPPAHGIYASNMYLGRTVDGRYSFDIKKTIGDEFDEFAEKCPDTFLSTLSGVSIKILDGSGSYVKKKKNSFTKLIFDDFPREVIIPQDRLFKLIPKSIDNTSNKSLIIGYYPLIDNTSHSIGAFTAFESNEYEKLNLLFVEMFLDLAKNQSQVFDGKTTILISADHGMFETSSKKVTLSELKQVIKNSLGLKPTIVMNTRSIFFYDIPLDKISTVKELLKKFLIEKEIVADIFTKDDDLIRSLLLSSERFVKSPNPDLTLLMVNEGIGVLNDIDDDLLFHGSHGGASCEEVFVPLIQIQLTPHLRTEILNHFTKIA